jgi:integrase
MASIEKRRRSDGTTGYRVVWRKDGQKDSLTFDDPAEAGRLKGLLDANGNDITAATQVMAAIRANVPTIAEVIEQHITALTGVERRTREDYRRMAANHITPHLGTIPITALDRLRCREWINQLVDDGMSAKTLRNHHALLSAALTWVNQETGWRPDNPAKGLALPDYHPAEMVFLTSAEVDLLLPRLAPVYRDVALFLVSTGVRWGELIALTVADIRRRGSDPYVSISKAVKRTPGGHYVGAPKSLRSRRFVSLPDALVPIIDRAAHGQPLDGLLFRGPRGGRLHHWTPAVRAAMATHTDDGDPVPEDQRLTQRPRIHDLRHTHASFLIAAGIDLPTVQRRLGHESITTTVDRYGHLNADQLRAGAQASDAFLRSLISLPEHDPDPAQPEPQPQPEAEQAVPRLRLVHGGRDPDRLRVV